MRVLSRVACMLAVATAVSPDGDGAFFNEDAEILTSRLSRTLLAEQQALTPLPPATTKAVQSPEPVAPKPAVKPVLETSSVSTKVAGATAPKPALKPVAPEVDAAPKPAVTTKETKAPAEPVPKEAKASAEPVKASAEPVAKEAKAPAKPVVKEAKAHAEIEEALTPSAEKCYSVTSAATDDWCQSTCVGQLLAVPGCDSYCCCAEDCTPKIKEQRVIDKVTAFTGKAGQCHFHQCTKDVCPFDNCVNKAWDADNCKGPRPVVYLNDGPHSGTNLITSALANLTGSYLDPKVGHWPEVLGNNQLQTKAIQAPVKFTQQYFCNTRRMDAPGQLAGFKWNTFGHQYVDTPAFDDLWQFLASKKIPVLHVLRNEVDSLVSTAKHDARGQSTDARHEPDAKVIIPIERSGDGKDAIVSLKEKLEHVDVGRNWLKEKYVNMGANVKVSSFELLLHKDPDTRLKEWKSVLKFYHADREAETLTLRQLNAFLDSYEKGYAQEYYDEVIDNWSDVNKELHDMGRSYRASLASRAPKPKAKAKATSNATKAASNATAPKPAAVSKTVSKTAEEPAAVSKPVSKTAEAIATKPAAAAKVAEAAKADVAAKEGVARPAVAAKVAVDSEAPKSEVRKAAEDSAAAAAEALKIMEGSSPSH